MKNYPRARTLLLLHTHTYVYVDMFRSTKGNKTFHFSTDIEHLRVPIFDELYEHVVGQNTSSVHFVYALLLRHRHRTFSRTASASYDVEREITLHYINSAVLVESNNVRKQRLIPLVSWFLFFFFSQRPSRVLRLNEIYIKFDFRVLFMFVFVFSLFFLLHRSTALYGMTRIFIFLRSNLMNKIYGTPTGNFFATLICQQRWKKLRVPRFNARARAFGVALRCFSLRTVYSSENYVVKVFTRRKSLMWLPGGVTTRVRYDARDEIRRWALMHVTT